MAKGGVLVPPTPIEGALSVPTDLSAEGVRELGSELRQLLADVFVLYVKTKNFHWHVSGPHYPDYHRMLDEQAAQVLAMADVIAERTRKLGEVALHSIGDIAAHQRLRDNSEPFVEAHAMLVELREDNLALTRHLRTAHEMCVKHNDLATASLLEVWIDETERRTWFLSATTAAGA